MIFKKKIKNSIAYRINDIKKHQSQTQQVNFDYLQISKLFSESNFIPFTTWSISPSTILHVLNDIVINKKQNIIEFGSGASTFYIAKLIKNKGLKVNFYSVEANLDWLNNLKTEIARHQLQEYVTFIYAPLTNVPANFAHPKQELWYDTNSINNALKNNIKFDLILVDGPIGSTAPHARYPAIPFLFSRLALNISVFLDDADRIDEKEIALKWSKLLNIEPKFRYRYVTMHSKNNFETMPFKIV